MTKYNVFFTIAGNEHSCIGESSYPTKEMYDKGEIDQQIVDINANMFISEYKKTWLLTDKKHILQNVVFQFP